MKLIFFFFSSRRRHTRFDCDWSSDVCSSDLLGDQGCVTLPLGRRSPNFRPERVASRLPDPATQPWPMGDRLPSDRPGAELDTAKVRPAVDAAFEPAEGMTAAVVVTWKGRIVGGRYRRGVT